MFNLYTEHIFRKTNHIPGVKINGHTRNINNLRYAEDTVLIAEDEASLQDLVTAVKDGSEKCGLLMNTKKTKVMLLTKDNKEKKVSIHIDHKAVIVVFCGRNGKFAAAKFAIFRNLPQILLFSMKNLIFHHFYYPRGFYKSDKVLKTRIVPFLHFLITVLKPPVCYTGSCPVRF